MKQTFINSLAITLARFLFIFLRIIVKLSSLSLLSEQTIVKLSALVSVSWSGWTIWHSICTTAGLKLWIATLNALKCSGRNNGRKKRTNEQRLREDKFNLNLSFVWVVDKLDSDVLGNNAWHWDCCVEQLPSAQNNHLCWYDNRRQIESNNQINKKERQTNRGTCTESH